MRSRVHVFRATPDAIPPMPADRTALGTLPFSAVQYCEALCTASAFGRYAFPAADLKVQYTGSEILFELAGEWRVLSRFTPNGFADYWDKSAPAQLTGQYPPFATSLFQPGTLQIWTGLLISTERNWTTLVRPLVNLPTSALFECYEGLVETDSYAPWPLFVNIRLKSAGTIIEFSSTKPLFQVQTIHRDCYAREIEVPKKGHVDPLPNEWTLLELSDLTPSDADSYLQTVRPSEPRADDHEIGRYAVQVRKRERSRRR